MQMRDLLVSIYDDEQFADLFAGRGRPVVPSWRLALVTVLQFMEGLADRQAADAVRASIDWKYALGLELTDAGFDYSVLSEFHARLVAGSAEERLLDVLLDACARRWYLKARGKQRTDSTHVLAAVRTLHRLERVAETLRATLNALALVAPEWLSQQVEASWFARYGRRIEEERLPKGQSARHLYVAQVGADEQRVLDAVDAPAAPERAPQAPEVAVLRRIWEQQFTRTPDGGFALCDPKALPTASEILESPYELEARYAVKRGRHWVGYKAHLTESCDADSPISSRRCTPPSLRPMMSYNCLPFSSRWPSAPCSRHSSLSTRATRVSATWRAARRATRLISSGQSTLTANGRDAFPMDSLLSASRSTGIAVTSPVRKDAAASAGLRRPRHVGAPRSM